ncbi:MAG: MFS transporter [Candidatus Lambdaproteobacteria bacterium]|nr:MFS transporter [Candidatus Lambdaproteobacteria bacterium]
MTEAAQSAALPAVEWIHKKNVLVLAICQALFMSGGSLLISVAGLVGLALAPDKALATVPVSIYVVGMAVATLPSSYITKRLGRRAGFLIGSMVGLLGALVCVGALMLWSFWLFLLGSMLIGAHAAMAQLYRFAATDAAPEHFRSRAISLVLAGGLVAAYVGPQIAKLTRNLVPGVEFMGAYIAAALLLVALALVLTQLRIPPPKASTLAPAPARPLGAIVSQPRFVVAVLSCMFGYGTMSLLMTSTPLAMVAHAHPFNDAATVIQWHVVGMFLPSFFTGSLINRMGELPVIFAGVVIDLFCVVVALGGYEFFNFWLALILVGLGWNFMFVGGSSLVTRTHNEVERAKTQGTNDFLTFATMSVASLSSGTLLHFLGWRPVLWTAVPMVSVVGVAVVVLAFSQRRMISAP